MYMSFEDTKIFKRIYNNYLEKRDLESENLLFRSLIFDDYDFLVAYREQNNRLVELDEDENNQIFLKIYLDFIETGEELIEQYSVTKIDFNEIIRLVNVYKLDGILINPFSDKLKLTDSQLKDLKRQKDFFCSKLPTILHQQKYFQKPSYKVKELGNKFTNNRVMELYDKYMKEENAYIKDDILNSFEKEIANNASFIKQVLPDEKSPKDSNGNPIVTWNRVPYIKQDDEKGYYLLYTDSSILLREDVGLDENDYITICDFDDIMSLIDSTYDLIDSLRIYGEYDLTIPIEDVNRFKIEKDINEKLKKAIVIAGAYTPNDEINLIEEGLKKYLNSDENFQKIWMRKQEYIYSGGQRNTVFDILIKSKVNSYTMDDFSKINLDLRKILKNKCFKVDITEKEITESVFTLIAE